MSEYNMSEHDKERPNNKEFFYIYNNKYIAKIEWNEEDNLYVGTLVSELRSYRDLAPIRDSVYFHGRDYNEVIKMFYQACDNYEGFKKSCDIKE